MYLAERYEKIKCEWQGRKGANARHACWNEIVSECDLLCTNENASVCKEKNVRMRQYKR